jgi:site-specific DNA-methyltransferase (cytosine-N4-specific)
MLTDVGDLVVDPFAGSCATGEAAERTKRRWICCDLDENYFQGALGRFQVAQQMPERPSRSKSTEQTYYKAYKPGSFWNGTKGEGLLENGATSFKPVKGM